MSSLSLRLCLSLLLCFAVADLAVAEDEKKLTLAEAKVKAAKEQKPILIKFFSKTCGDCKRMKRGPLGDSIVKDKLSEFIVVELDTEADKELAEGFRVQHLPSFVALSPSAVVVDRASRFMEKDRFLNYLSEFKTQSRDIEKQSSNLRKSAESGDYKSVVAWGKYLAKRGNHMTAIQVFKTLLNNDKLEIDERQVAGNLAVNSELLIKRFEDCRKTAKATVELRPKSDRAAFAKYIVAYSFEATQERQKAISRYQNLIKEFPDSRFAKIAKNRLKTLEK